MGIHSVLRVTLLAAVFIAFVGSVRGGCLQQSADATDSSTPTNPNCAGENCSPAQAPQVSPPSAVPADNAAQETQPETSVTFKKVFLNLPDDQKTIWTSPFRSQWKDSLWAVPVAGATGGMVRSRAPPTEPARSHPRPISPQTPTSHPAAARPTPLPAQVCPRRSRAS